MHIRTSMAAVMFSAVFFAYPAHAQYAGPSVVAAVTVEEILNRPVDDQEI